MKLGLSNFRSRRREEADGACVAANPPPHVGGYSRSLNSRLNLAFSLIEVMIALAIFFICTFAILGLVSQLLRSTRVFQTKKSPHVSLVHAWYTSKTNRVTEGVTTVEFSDISDDLGQLYRDYYAEINAEPDLEMTNGLWDVSYQVINRNTRQVESKVFTFYWDPNSQSRQLGGGLRR